MSSLRFPAIQTKKTLIEEEDYNFINKDKKKKTSTSNPLQIVQELKRKIQQQKKQIQNRNITIQGLQRNFQSLSVIVKTEKAQSATLRAQLEALKNFTENGDKKMLQLHEKCILLQRENKLLKEQVKGLKKGANEAVHLGILNQQLKKQIIQMEEANQKLHAKLMQKDTEKKILQVELSKLKNIQKDHRLLNQTIVDLEHQIKQLTDSNNSFSLKINYYQQELEKIKSESLNKQKKNEDFRLKIKDLQKQKERCEMQIDYFRGQNGKLNRLIDEKQRNMQNKEMYARLREEDELKLRRQIQSINQKCSQMEETNNNLREELKQKDNAILMSNNQISILQFEQQNLKENFKNQAMNYSKQIARLSKGIKDLQNQLNMSTGQSAHLSQILGNQQQKINNYQQKMVTLNEDIQQMNRKMRQYQQRFGNYLKLILKNQPDVIITNQREMAKLQNNSATYITSLHNQITKQQQNISELQGINNSKTINIETMRKYIKSLEEEVTTKSEELIQKTRQLRKYEEQESELNRMIELQRQHSESFKKQAEEKIIQRMRQLQYEKLRSKKEIQEEKQRLEYELMNERQRNEQKLKRQQQKSQKYTKLLEGYRNQQQKLKKMMIQEQQQLKKLQKQKQDEIKRIIREKQQQVQRQKMNNKLLWSDNKKLKQLQNQLRQESQKQLQQKQLVKRQQMERLKKQLQRKYKEEMDSMKSEESNSNELKKILMERTSQQKSLTQNFNKLKTQCQFYKNRNKQLQALVARVEKQYKDKSIELERENKSNKQVIQVLDKKLKQGETNISQLQKKQKRELKYLYDQIEAMKNKIKNQRVEEKISLVNKSITDLDTSLKTLMNTMSCNYCVQVVKECVRLECGHIYCKKCKGGYEPNCGQCKRKGSVSSDKMIDESVSKAQYMRILINTIREDLNKISHQ